MLSGVRSKQLLISIHIFLIYFFFLPADLVHNRFQLHEIDPLKAQRVCARVHTCSHEDMHVYVSTLVCVRAAVFAYGHCTASHRWLGFYYVYTRLL